MTKTPKKQPAMYTPPKSPKGEAELKELKRRYRRHETETLHVLQKRLKRLKALAAAKERGLPDTDLCRRYEVSPVQLRHLLAEHALYMRDESSAVSIFIIGVTQFRGRKNQPKKLFMERRWQVLCQLETARGLRRALERDPQQATFRSFANRLLVISVRITKKLREWN